MRTVAQKIQILKVANPSAYDIVEKIMHKLGGRVEEIDLEDADIGYFNPAIGKQQQAQDAKQESKMSEELGGFNSAGVEEKGDTSFKPAETAQEDDFRGIVKKSNEGSYYSGKVNGTSVRVERNPKKQDGDKNPDLILLGDDGAQYGVGWINTSKNGLRYWKVSIGKDIKLIAFPAKSDPNMRVFRVSKPYTPKDGGF